MKYMIILLPVVQLSTASFLPGFLGDAVDTVTHPIAEITHPVTSVLGDAAHSITNPISQVTSSLPKPLQSIANSPHLNPVTNILPMPFVEPVSSILPGGGGLSSILPIGDDSDPISDMDLTKGTKVTAGRPVTDPLLQAAIKQFTPYFIFHQDESYYPASVDSYLKNVKLYDMRDPNQPKLISNQPTPLTFDYLATLPKEVQENCFLGVGAWKEWRKLTDVLSFKDKIRSMPFLKGDSLVQDQAEPEFPGVQFSPSPVYTVVRQTNNFTYVYYWTFYAWNEGKYSFGDHFGDLESVVMKLEKKDEKYRPVSMKISQHDFDNKFDANDSQLQFLKTDFDPELKFGHLILYVAKGSHGLNVKPENVKYGPKGLLEDEFSQGSVHWRPWLQMNDANTIQLTDDIVDNCGQNFMFRGRWGDLKVCKEQPDCQSWDLICRATQGVNDNLCSLDNGPRGISIRDFVKNPDF